MAIYKCKMCGGELSVTEGMTVVECEFCDSKQTIPSLDNEKKLTLFNRANRLRFSCDFDKAAGIYEAIVADFPDEAEAYWGLVLCTYGIEYVDDPATAKKVPTCHRSSFNSIFDDENFQQALENSDVLARSVYRDEAKQIEEIRKGIIEVSSKEEPYDIFICYKETDENGERTIDSVIAQDVYTELVNKGYRVFFSRITLEDKLGQVYEPYIFAALNSAKIMLAFGTDYEYYNAVWVKNEWSRFLQLIAKGEKKTLIPCYKGIDAYDMPKEFAKLQAQDMGKVGAIQDLLRGIEKIIGTKICTQENMMQEHIQNVSAEATLKRAFIFISNGEWKKALNYLEKVLDIYPECAQAYIGKLMCTFQISESQQLSEVTIAIESLSDYKNALKFATPQLRIQLESYVVKQNSRRKVSHKNRDYIYTGDFEKLLPNGTGKCVWTNGAEYEGEWKDGERHGKGIHHHANGEKYEGEWRNGVMYGEGIYYYSDGSKFKGTFKDNQPFSGVGKVKFKNNEYYIGEFYNKQRHGVGTHYYADKARYEGEWNENKKHGKGILFYSDGNKFEGDFIDGRPTNGLGVINTATMCEEGEFENGRLNGQGKRTILKGKYKDYKIIGEFVDGSCNGRATYYWADGSYYVGDYYNGLTGKVIGYRKSGQICFEGFLLRGQYNGNCRIYNEDGSGFVGVFNDGKANGRGAIISFNAYGTKQKLEGYFENGNLIEGHIIYLSGEAKGVRYEGGFKNGCRFGLGTLYYPDGSKLTGNFADDALNGWGTVYNSLGFKMFDSIYKDGKEIGPRRNSGLFSVK